jgi:hypothetical protein
MSEALRLLNVIVIIRGLRWAPVILGSSQAADGLQELGEEDEDLGQEDVTGEGRVMSASARLYSVPRLLRYNQGRAGTATGATVAHLSWHVLQVKMVCLCARQQLSVSSEPEEVDITVSRVGTQEGWLCASCMSLTMTFSATWTKMSSA